MSWKKINGRPGDQRLFRNTERQGLFVCDNSGRNPDETDDGPLKVNVARKALVNVGTFTTRLHVMIPVLLSDGRESRCSAGVWAVPDLKAAGLEVEIDSTGTLSEDLGYLGVKL